VTPEERVRQLEAQLDRAKRELADQRAADRRKAADEAARLATARWQYAFVPVRDVDAEAFVQVLQEREAGGWDYAGQATLKKEGVWAFRRPVGGVLSVPAGQPSGRNGPMTSATNYPNTRFPADNYPALPVPGNSAWDPVGPRPGSNATPPGELPAGSGSR
jgi:hypothetical protein